MAIFTAGMFNFKKRLLPCGEHRTHVNKKMRKYGSIGNFKLWEC
jgi:hypothetical protein